MFDPFLRNSPKINQAAALLGDGDVINAIEIWREAMQAHGRCAVACEDAAQSVPLHACAVCFEGQLWNTALYAPEVTGGGNAAFSHQKLAQILRDWLTTMTDIAEPSIR